MLAVFCDLFLPNIVCVCVSVPTMAIVHQGHNRFLERALCLAGPNAEKTEKTENDSDSDSDSSVGSAAYSLKSFSDFDEDSAMSVVLDSNSPVLVPPQKTVRTCKQLYYVIIVIYIYWPKYGF